MAVTREAGRGFGETVHCCPLRILNSTKERDEGVIVAKGDRKRDGNNGAASRHSSTFVN